MPRVSRALIDGGYYHIVTRGIDRRRLFRCKHDYEYFLAILKQYQHSYEVKITNYCIMPNHIHLLLKAIKASDLPKFMQSILQVYAVTFRKRYGSVGFIFQNRYKSRSINNDAYLLECARYIERNPLRAGIVDNLSRYKWSSFSYYAYGSTDDIIIMPNLLYSGLAHIQEKRQEAYIKYVSEDRPYDLIVDKVFKIR
ncbi:MAG: transposase [Candidatus Omnitrophota bacterium]